MPACLPVFVCCGLLALAGCAPGAVGSLEVPSASRAPPPLAEGSGHPSPSDGSSQAAEGASEPGGGVAAGDANAAVPSLPPPRLRVSAAAATITRGQALDVSVRLLGSDDGLLATGPLATAQVELSVDEAPWLSDHGRPRQALSGGETAFSGLVLDVAGSYTLRATMVGLAPGAEAQAGTVPVQVSPAPLATATLDVLSAEPTSPSLGSGAVVAASGELTAAPRLYVAGRSGAWSAASARGVVVAPDGSLRLGTAGGCDGSATNCVKLAADWTPAFDSLVGYWPLEGSGLVADGASIAGELGGALTAHNPDNQGLAYAPGQIGTGLALDGVDSYLTLPATLAGATTLTVAMWFKLAEQRDWQRLIDLNQGPGDPALMVTARGQRVGGAPWGILAALGAAGHTGARVADLQNAQVGSWHHMALTVDGTAARLYVDGWPRGQGATTVTVAAVAPTQMAIGKSGYTSDPLLAGTIDEVALWSVALQPAEVAALFDHQSAPRAGTFTTQAVDAGRAAAWRRLGWRTELPAGKPLVLVPEAAADYPGLSEARERLGAPPRLLWPLDEAASSVPTGFREVVAGRLATPRGLSMSADRLSRDVWGLPGRVGGALALGPFYTTSSNLGPYLSTDELEAGLATFSLGGWVAPTGYATGQLIAFVDTATGPASDRNTTQGRMLYIDQNGRARLGLVTGGNPLTLGGSASVRDGRWHHLLGSVAPTAATLFVDGAQVAQVALGSTSDPQYGAWRLGGNALCESGWPGWAYNTFDTRMAEVGVWPRAIAVDEARALWHRGALNARLRLRACAAAGCTDEPPWRGPGGGPTAFYTEAQNDVAGLVRPAAPDLDLMFVAGGAPAPARYAQAEVRLESWETAATCGPSADEPCSPGLQGLSLGLTPPGAPPAAVDFQPTAAWFALDAVEEVLGASGCPGGVTYNLHVHGRPGWWAWLGGEWRQIDGTGMAGNAAAELTHDRLATFGREVGRGAVTLRAFLGGNDETNACALKNVVLRGVAAGS